MWVLIARDLAIRKSDGLPKEVRFPIANWSELFIGFFVDHITDSFRFFLRYSARFRPTKFNLLRKLPTFCTKLDEEVKSLPSVTYLLSGHE